MSVKLLSEQHLRTGKARLSLHLSNCSLSKNINSSLVLVQPRKTCPFITERLLKGRKESYQTNKHCWKSHVVAHLFSTSVTE